jgi:hypothetical protein
MKNLYLLITLSFFVARAGAQSTDTTRVGTLMNDDPETAIELPEITYEVEEIVVETEEKEFSKGKHPAVVVTIPQATTKDVEDALSKLIKSGLFKKVDKSGGELSAMETTLERINDQPMNVYSMVMPAEGSTKVWAFFEQDSTFLNAADNPREFTEAKAVMKDFGVDVYKAAVAEELEKEEEKLEELEKDLQKMRKDNLDFQEEIRLSQSKISDKEGDINASKAEQERKRNEIEQQRNVVRNSSGDLQKEEEKELKSLEKDLKKLQKDNESLHKDIVDYNGDISEAEREIEKNLDLQALEKPKISKQLWQVKSVEAKLNAIK